MFRAKYSGTCVVCGRDITPGENIKWSRRQKGKYAHVSCEQTQEPMGIKNTIKEWAEEQAAREAVQETPKAEAVKVKVTVKKASGSDAVLDALAENILARFPKIKTGVDEEAVKAIVAKAMPKYTLVKLVTSEGREVNVEGPQHNRFPELLYYVGRRENVYLYGPTQTGKTTAGMMVAKALGLPFYYLSLNPQTPDSRLMGYKDANGNYIETVFYKAYTEGGVIVLDEGDNSSASLMTTLNSALANGHGSFPNGMKERHKDCVVIVTGNTPGRGGTPEYPERRALDSAFTERFRFVYWGYDEALETALVTAHNETAALAILDWIRKVRFLAKEKGLRVHATPTAGMALADYAKDGTLTVDAALDALIFKGVDTETRAQIVSEVSIRTLKGVWK